MMLPGPDRLGVIAHLHQLGDPIPVAAMSGSGAHLAAAQAAGVAAALAKPFDFLLLESEPDRSYDLVVTPRKVVVDSPSHGSQIFTVDQLAALLQASIHGRQASAPAEP